MTAPSMSDNYADLDAEELFHLGIKASREHREADALRFLKLAIDRRPEHAQAKWLLGAEYASLGMPERAREQLQAAVRLDPALHTARFQWGLLELTSGQVDTAREIWTALDALPEAHALRLFKQGMLELAADDTTAALHNLQRALDDATLDTALRRDIQMVIGQIEAQRSAAQDTSSTITATDDTSADNHLMLSAYRRGLQ